MKKSLLALTLGISQVVASSLIGSYSLDINSSGDSSGAKATISHDGKYLYLGDGYSGFSILDVTNPEYIRELANTKDSFSANSEYAVIIPKLSDDGKLLYLATSEDILVYNVTDKLNPKYVSKLDTDSYVFDFEFSPNSEYLYVADNTKLGIYSEGERVFTTSFTTASRSMELDKENDRLYVGHKAGFDVFDISNQKEPLKIERVLFEDAQINGTDIKVLDNYIIVAGGYRKAVIIVYDKSDYSEITRYDLSSNNYISKIDLSRDKTKLYVTDIDTKSYILDISDVKNITEITTIDRQPRYVNMIIPSLDETKVFVVGSSGGANEFFSKVDVYDISEDKFSLNLNSGWQLVSFAGTLNVDISKNDYISSMYSYNNGIWSSNIDDITLGGGVWIKSTKNVNLEVDITKYEEDSFTYELKSGWNLKGGLFDFYVNDLEQFCVTDLRFYDKTRGWLNKSDIVVTKENQGFWISNKKSQDCNVTISKTNIGNNLNEIGVPITNETEESVTDDLNKLTYCEKIKFTDASCSAYLQYSDLDSDGLIDSKELEYKTSPFMSDSDGDGVSDYDEVYSGASFYNPTIANIPQFTISSLENFDIVIWSTEEETETVSLEESNEYSQSVEKSVSEGGSNSKTNTKSHSDSVTVGFEYKFGGTDGGLTLHGEYERSWTEETAKTKEVNWDVSSTEAASNAVGKSETNEYSKTVSYDGGKVLGTFTLTNLTPELEYDVEGLSFNLYTKDEFGDKTLVTTLFPTDYLNEFGVISHHTLGGGELATQKLSVTHKDDYIEIGKTFSMLENPNSIVIEPNYHQINIDGKPINTTVQNKTVSVIIDYFENPIADSYFYNGFKNSYLISKLDYDENKKSFTLNFNSIKEVLEAYPYNYKFTTANQRINRCRDSKESEWKDCRETTIQSKFDVCLDGVCEENEIPTKSFETLVQISSDRMKNPNALDDWMIYSDDIAKSELCDYFYPCMNFSEMSIDANKIGTSVAFYNYKDSDSDGLEDRVELKFNSNQYTNDSDSDGIDDFTEIAIFKTNVNRAVNYEYVSEPKRTWDDANTYAKSKGGRLLVINSEDEFNKVNELLNITERSWIGGYRSDFDEDNLDFGWAWVDGSEFTYSNWNSGQPDNSSASSSERENCIGMRPETDRQWFDEQCSTENSFIIEYGNLRGDGFEYEDPYLDTDNDGLTNVEEKYKYLTSEVLEDTDGDGASDYQEINEFFTDPNSDENYKIISPATGVTHSEAKLIAKSAGGALFVANTPAEFTFIRGEFNSAIGTRTWVANTTEADDAGTCSFLNGGMGYYSVDCNERYNQILVEYALGDTPVDVNTDDSDSDGLIDSIEGAEGTGTSVTNPDTDGDGLSDGEEVNTYLTDPLDDDSDDDGATDFKEVMHFGTDPNNAVNYEIITDSLNWDGAQSQAIIKGGHLVIINSEEEREFMNKELGIDSNANYWIGLSKEDTANSKYTDWNWIDGTEFRYSNWRDSKPDRYTNKKSCAIIHGTKSNYGHWSDQDCTNTFDYIIEYGNKAEMKPNGVMVYKDSNTATGKNAFFGPNDENLTFSTNAVMIADTQTNRQGVASNAQEITNVKADGYDTYYEFDLSNNDGTFFIGFNNKISRVQMYGCWVLFSKHTLDNTSNNAVLFIGENKNRYLSDYGLNDEVSGIALYCKESYSK